MYICKTASSITSFKVFGANEADLTVKAKKTSLYVCRVNNHFNEVVFSEWVKLKVLDIDKSGKRRSLFVKIPTALCPWCDGGFFSSGLPSDWQGEPHIAVNPDPQTVQQGTDVTLRCAAFGIPTPHYQWYRNGQELLKKTGDTLQVNKGFLPDSECLHTHW